MSYFLDKNIWLVTFLTLCFIIFETVNFFNTNNIYQTVIIGENFISKSDKSELISSKKQYAIPNDGYDGQFYYFIAIDPQNARYYMDDAFYRYSRIFYSFTARILSFGNLERVPYSMLIINVLAVTLSVGLLALWLQKNKLSPYFSLIYGFYPGLHFSIRRDLTEPLAYLLVIIANYLLDSKSKWKYLFVGLIFSLAILTRETTALFALANLIWGTSRLLMKKIKNKEYVLLASSMVISVMPYFLYKSYLINNMQLTSKYLSENLMVMIPFWGIIQHLPGNFEQVIQIVSVIIPGIIMGLIGLYLLIKKQANQYVLALLLNILILVVFLGGNSYIEYISSGRITTGVILASLLSLPVITSGKNKLISIFMVVVVLWLLAWKMIPLLHPLKINLIIPLIALFAAALIIAQQLRVFKKS